MKKLRNHLIGIEQGDVPMFSDFEDNGEMWTGSGPRERRRRIRFSEPFRSTPAVHVSLSLADMDSSTNVRAEATAERIGKKAFELVFRTWGDSRVARIRISWMAIGELSNEDDWQVD